MNQSQKLMQSAFSLKKKGGLKALHRVGFDSLTTPGTLNYLDFASINRKCAFTLAEVLITLGIVGVVAALTLPSVMENINERKNSERQANTVFKITQATDKMKAMGLLTQFSTTEEFVNELKNHLKLAKICDNNHIAECWPTSKVTMSDGNELEISKVKTSKNLQMQWQPATNTMGLILADGGAIILAYNPTNEGMLEGETIVASPSEPLPMGGGKTKVFGGYTTNTTSGMAFVMDVNGGARPNSETINNQYKDIRSFRGARLSTGCAGVDIPGIGCVVNTGGSYKWEKAGRACTDAGMSLPDIGTLKSIYAQRSNYPDLPQSGIFWSSSGDSTWYAHAVNFGYGAFRGYKPDLYGVLCVGD